jgi:hypothetical protein
MLEVQIYEVEVLDEGIDETNRIVVADILIQGLGWN